MNERPHTILNIGIDRALLNPQKNQEPQLRQLFYCDKIPARIVHLVKAPRGTSPKRLDFDTRMSVVPCVVPHWSLFVPLALWQGAKLLREERFDFIQVQDPHLTGIAGALLSAIFKVPLICGLFSDEVDNPGWLRERFLNRFANRLAQIVLRHSRAARSDSRAVAERVLAGGYCPVTFIPFLITHADKLMTPDPAAHALRERLLDGKEGPLLLAAGRLEPEKNMSMMIEAVAKAIKQHPGMVLAVAGSGRLADDLRRQAAALMPEHIRWLGWIPATEMGAYYQASDLLLISSDRESAARVLSESLFSETPVLSTDTAGAREVVVDNVSGRIVPVGDFEGYTRALLDLTGDLMRLKEMGRTGRESVESRMTGPAVASALRDFYTKARSA